MTRTDLQSRLQNFFNNPFYYSVDDMNESIQDGLDEVCAFTGCIYKSVSLTFQPGKSYYDLLTLLPDYVGVVAIFNSVVRRWMVPISIKKLDQVRIDWETAFGTPWYFVPINHRYISIFRKPSSNYGLMYLFYVASAPSLDDSTVIPISDDHMDALEEYSITDLWEQNQEISKSTANFELYTKRLDKLRVYMRNKRNSDRVASLR